MAGNAAGRPFSSRVLIALVFVLGIGAFVSGPMLFLVPDGSLMKMSADILKGTPFPDYLIPGIVLFIFIGLYPLVVCIGLAKRSWKSLEAINPLKTFHWSWTASLVAGIALLIWIAAETLWLGYVSFLQPVMAVWGILILLFALLPGVKRYYRK